MFVDIKLNSLEDVKDLNKIACEQPFSLHVSAGHQTIDARSILALIALMGKTNLRLVAPDHLSFDKFNEIISQI